MIKWFREKLLAARSAGRWTKAGGMLAAIGVALAGAELWKALNFPLPWLVGSLYAVALARINGLQLISPPGARQAGQWVIGINMGLYFSATVVAELVSHAPLILGMALFSLLLGGLGAALLMRFRLADAPTAFFAAMPGGASEMANLSDMWNASVDRVAAAHVTRVMLVVLVVPLGLALAGSHGAALGELMPHPVAWQHFPAMIAVSLLGIALFLKLRIPNAWVLGNLAAIAILGIAGYPLSGMPGWLSACGQVLIGTSLGCRFGPGFLRQAPAFLAGVTVQSLLLLAATVAAAFLVSPLAHLGFPNLILSFAPGGIAEMSLTASHLNLGVPLVVASHVVRLAILTILAPVSFRIFSRLVQSPT